jgi:acetylornithine deacetylase/succinyl-diaminopimelate desuccinylase-like protein
VIIGHLDVVKASKEDWKHDPFAATIVDGMMYGRGTLDMKYFIAASLELMAHLVQIEKSLTRGVTFVFTADEEKGSSFGMKRLLSEEGIREELSNKIVLNEGGGFSLFDEEGNCHYLYETGQKSVCRLRVKVEQSSDFNPYFPNLTHDAVVAQVISTLQNLDVDTESSSTSDALCSIFADGSDEKKQRLIETMSHSMITATLIHGGARNTLLEPKIRATVDFDCRLLPNVSQEIFLQKVESSLCCLHVKIELLQFSQVYESTPKEDFQQLLFHSLQKFDSSIKSLLPFVTPGSNDGKFLQPLGCEVYGFSPLVKSEPFPEIMPLIHGVNERISLESIEFCFNVLDDIVTTYLKGENPIDK